MSKGWKELKKAFFGVCIYSILLIIHAKIIWFVAYLCIFRTVHNLVWSAI
jgi:hypothetical protein